MEHTNAIVHSCIFCILGIMICTVISVIVKKLISKTELQLNGIKGNSKEKRNKLHKLQIILRAYRVEYIFSIIVIFFCATMLVFSILTDFLTIINYAVLIMIVVAILSFGILQIASLDSTIRQKTRREEIIEASIFVIGVVLVILYKVLQ